MSPKYFALVIVLACVGVSVAQVYKGSSPGATAPQEVVKPPAPAASPKNDFITQTVYGFLDFTTTIGNTVMVFSPQSAPPEGSNKVEKPASSSTIETKPAVAHKKSPNIQASKTHKSEHQAETKKQPANKGTKIVVNSAVEPSSQNNVITPVKSEKAKTRVEPATKSPVLSSVVQVRAQSDTPGIKNNLAEPEYDFLSKQPTEIVDETYKVINLRPSSKTTAKPRPSPKKDKENPTGLVTKLGGTIVKDGLTTVHETSVIGTYINGKYAQVLQSTSRILKGSGTPSIPEGKIRPSNTQRILKTIGPQHGKLKPQLEPTPTHQQEESSLPLEGLFNPPQGPVRTTRRHSGNHQPRLKFRNKIVDDVESNEAPQQQQQPRNIGGKSRPSNSRPSYKNRQITTTTEGPPTTRRRSGFRPSNNQPSAPAKAPKSRPEQPAPSNGPTLPKAKLPRTQGRWSYKTPPKPRIAIRKQAEDEERAPTTSEGSLRANEPSTPLSTGVSEERSLSTPPSSQRKIQEASFDDELDPSETEEVSIVQEQQQPQQQSPQQQQAAEQILPVETLNVEISTPADFDDIYFEIATIKSPYTFQVGTMKNTRYVTVTSTMKKTFATAEVPSPTASPNVTPTEPLTENILANTGAAYESSLPLDSSIATLPAITLESGQATPPLETLTETFSTTQTLLKTHMLPVVSGGNTTRLTLVQTYNIARIVTATKTLPPMEIYQFIPSKTLNEFNSKLDEAGSELHLELDFGDDERDDDDIPKRVVAPNSTDGDTDLDVFRHQSSKQKQEQPHSPEPQLTPEQIQQIALLKYFGQPPQAQPQVITTSRPVIVLETVYESHVIPLVNGGNTIYSTLSRPVATVPRTSYEYGTSTVAPIIPQQVPQVPQLPPQLFPPQQPQFTITSAPLVTQTVATVSESRVLKLTFGAKTAYTTLFSTRVVPTEVTTYVTSTVPLQPSVQAFPGYYPPPVGYPPFPFVG